MDSDRINRWLALGANVGVLVGIILLIVELDQNREMMRAQTRNEVAAEIIDLLTDITNNEQFASVYRRGMADEELTADESMQFRVRTIALFRYFENVHYQYRLGLYDEDEFAAQKNAWKGTFRSRLATEVWCRYRPSISPEARAEIDALVTDHMCSD